MGKYFTLFFLGSLLHNQVHAVLSLQVTTLVHETCNYANGVIWVSGVGGTAPYTYSWADGPMTAQRSGLSAGSYTVTVTDAVLDQASITVDILSNPYSLMAIAGALPWCTAPGDILEDPQVSGLPNTWTVNSMPTELLPGSGPNLEPWFRFQPDAWQQSFTYTVDDGNGCSGTISGNTGPQVTSWPDLTITSVEPSCNNQSIGAIHIQSSGAAPGGWSWVNLIRDDGVPLYQTYAPDAGTLDLSFENLEPGYYGIHWWLGVTAENLDPGECSYDTMWVTVPNLGPTCGSVQGTSYIDLDGDCIQDANEVGVPYSPLLLQPGNEAVLTNGSGQFVFGLLNGSYTLEQTDPTLVTICPLPQPVPFIVNTDLTTIELANSSTEPLDLRVSLAGSVFRPGFNSHYFISVQNASPQQSGPVTLVLDLDPALVYVTSEVMESSISGSTITWDLPAFTSYQTMHWYVTVQVPVGTPLGTPLNTGLTVINTLPDANSANDNDTDNDLVVGSYDPNDKRAVTSTRASNELYFINGDEWIDYTIRFQNTGTFPAEFVVITDTIAPELDLLTFEQGVASHPFTVSFKPGRVIEWRFDDIQLPDSTSDESGSHGLVKFRMRPNGPLVPGTIITNTANIYFDYNEPVITEPSVLVAEFTTEAQDRALKELDLLPNPTRDRLFVNAVEGSIGSITILAADGREVMRSSIRSSSAALDVSILRAGSYSLTAIMANGSIVREHFIKQ